ncbi:MAG: hypothetical protein M3Z85_16200 [Acidobacteriota bacterium]|nr:hypothetical protein [Acidobacteriota bacterium]
MRYRSIPIFAGCGFLSALLQLVAALFGSAAGIAAASAIAIICFFVFRFFGIKEWQPWAAMVTAAAGSAAGITILNLASANPPDVLLWWAPGVALAVSAALAGFERSSSKRCALCNRRLGRQISFLCPRCGLLVCEQNCWAFEHCRCRLCEQNRVPVLPADSRWWDKRFGPRSNFGKCQICMAAAAETDLRVCGKCGRPQCRECWDFANGQCSHCQWILTDLPEQLQPFMRA